VARRRRWQRAAGRGWRQAEGRRPETEWDPWRELTREVCDYCGERVVTVFRSTARLPEPDRLGVICRLPGGRRLVFHVRHDSEEPETFRAWLEDHAAKALSGVMADDEATAWPSQARGRGRKRMQRVELHCYEPDARLAIAHGSLIPAESVDDWLDLEAETFFASGGWVEIWCANRGLQVFDREFRDVAAVRDAIRHAVTVCAETFGDDEEDDRDASRG